MSQHSFSYNFTATLHDVDAAGVMFFAHTLRHAHDCYEKFMQHIGLSLDSMLQQGDYQLPLVHSEADFTAPIQHGDAVTIQLQVEKIGRSSFTLQYLFSNREGNKLADIQSVHVATKTGTGESMALPDKLRTMLQQHLQ